LEWVAISILANNPNRRIIAVICIIIVLVGISIGISFMNNMNQNNTGTSTTSPSTTEVTQTTTSTFQPIENVTTTTTSIPVDIDLDQMGILLPNFSYLLTDLKYHNISELRGQYAIIMFMATWCTASKSQGIRMESIYAEYSDTLSIISLSVDTDDTIEMVADYKETNSFSWFHGIDSSSSMKNYFHLVVIPTIIIIDSEGFLRWKHIGVWGETDMIDTLTLLMQ
jgi:thiol-disulfide isomerase/thioredoxin